jgi:lipid II:glycine glycyltransferase (peptidoglycan interpeptide bridge formation enzyme)
MALEPSDTMKNLGITARDGVTIIDPPRSSSPTRDSRRVFTFDPLSDERWDRFVLSHPGSSVFHSSAWLGSLRRTYQYEPIAFTTSAGSAELKNAVVFCRVNSWLTGKRLVSLPFSDHCDPLVDQQNDLVDICAKLTAEFEHQQLRHIEVRPTCPLDAAADAFPYEFSHCLHRLDLRPSITELFRRLHKDSTQRKIQRAERECVRYEEGRSKDLLEAFNLLFLMTRRRHFAPPQPLKWFQNLIECFGQDLSIRVAFKGKHPIAAVIMLRHKATLVYKYGCSDARFHRYGGMHLLLWRSILQAKQDGLLLFDFGRSDWSTPGLIAFKDRWGAARSVLTYSRMLDSKHRPLKRRPEKNNWKERAARILTPLLPDSVFRAIGSVMYHHFG